MTEPVQWLVRWITPISDSERALGRTRSTSASCPVRAAGLTTRTCSITQSEAARPSRTMVSPACGSGGPTRVTGASRPSARTRNSRSLPAGSPVSAVAGLGADPRTAGVAPTNLIPGQLRVEQDLATGVGSDHAVTGPACPEPVDRSSRTALQHSRSECVEVVLLGEQQHRGDALELRAPAGGRSQQFTGGKFQAGRPDPLTLFVQSRPHQDLQAQRPQGSPQFQTQSSPPTSSGRARAGRVTEPPGHRYRRQAVDRHGDDDDEKRDRKDLRCTPDVL